MLRRPSGGSPKLYEIVVIAYSRVTDVPHLRRSKGWAFFIPALRPGLLTAASSRLVSK